MNTLNTKILSNSEFLRKFTISQNIALDKSDLSSKTLKIGRMKPIIFTIKKYFSKAQNFSAEGVRCNDYYI